MMRRKRIVGQDLVDKALTQKGDPYVYGKEVELDDADPDAFDCSELVEWVCAQLNVRPFMPDGTIYQIRHCRNHDNEAYIDDAITTPGALLFYFSDNPFEGGRPSGAHVAISQGNGKTIEARGRRYGVNEFDAYNRGWTHAGLVPGVAYLGYDY